MKMKFFSKNKYLFLTIIYAIIIFIVSAIPGHSLSRYKILSFDKFLHFSVYFGFGILLFKANIEQLNVSERNILILTIIIGLFYGISDEVHQLFVINRTASVYDVIADFLGIVFGTVFIFKLSKKK